MDGSTHKASARNALRAKAEKKTTSAEGKAEKESPRHYISPTRSQVIIASECPAVESSCGLPIPCPTMLFMIKMVVVLMFSLPLYAADTSTANTANATETHATVPAVIDLAGPAPAAPALETPKTDAAKVESGRPSIEQQPIRHKSESSGAITASSGPEESKKNNGSTINTSIQVFCALAVVIGLILLGRNLARKYIPGAATGNGKGIVEVLARHPLNRNQSIVLVRIGSQIVALNQTKEGSQSILVISDQMEVANILGQVQGLKTTSIQKQFNGYLQTAEKELEAGEDPDLLEASKAIEDHDLDAQLDEMAAARRQLMELRQQVKAVSENLR